MSRITEIENTLRQHGEILTKLYEELHKAQAKNAELVTKNRELLEKKEYT